MNTKLGEMVSYVGNNFIFYFYLKFYKKKLGTTMYMAPEIQTNGGLLMEDLSVNNDQPNRTHRLDEGRGYIGYGRAVDLWSTGCVVLEMLSGKVCFFCYCNKIFC